MQTQRIGGRLPGADAEGIVQLVVADTGDGIPPELVERVFEPFFTTKPQGRGTGLGLSMVYGMVRQSGGDVTLGSDDGVGARVMVQLPVVCEPLHASTERSGAED